jgi:hypothetical protein
MAGNVGNLALEGGDPREAAAVEMNDRTIPNSAMGTGQKLHDPNVTFEEYLFWAKLSRADERYEDPNRDFTLFGKVIRKSRRGPATLDVPAVARRPGAEKLSGDEKELAEHNVGHINITDEEWVTASRAVRSASWGAVFYLITTDILGPFGNPYAFAAMGYGPGVVLFTIFGILAAYGGFLLWRMFLGLDSDRYPLKTYGDIAFRVFGTTARHSVNVLQSVQLLFNVGIIIVASGLGLEQIITGAGKNSVCFIVLCFIWAIAGGLAGQIRSLKNLGWIAHSAIWMNVFVIIMTMAVIPSTGIQAQSAIAANGQFNIQPGDPIRTSAGALPGTTFITQVNGLGQAIYAYGGAMLFVEFMAEMRKPFDFWKGMIFAQSFIYFCYMFFGLFVYSYQGQYSLNPAYQGIGSYTWQTVANAIELVSGMIAALLYGNIGLKVVYNNVFMDLFRFPSLGTRAGKIAWVGAIPVYWGVAFVVAAAIPQVTNLAALISSLCILQFSYTFPPWLVIGYMYKKHSMLEGDGFDPTTGQTIRQDSGFKRFWRGFSKNLFFNLFNVFFCLGSAVCAIIGIYSAAQGIKIQYSTGAGSSFSCNNPYG